MGTIEWVIVIIVGVWAAAALFFIVGSKKKGKSCSCGGCDSCRNCSACARKEGSCAHCDHKIDD